MERAVQDYLSSASSIKGSILTDSNGLLISAQGTLKDKGSSAGRISSISRQAQQLFPSNSNVTVLVQMSNDDQVLVKRVGQLTVAINESK